MTDSPRTLIPLEGEGKIDLFQRQEIRKVMHDNEWWFSVKDVLEALTGTSDGNRYSRDLREKDEGLRSGWAEITRTLPFPSSSGGGTQMTTFINVEGIFRLLQTIPSTKVEPFKRWLARVGFERLKEIQNPELALKRAITLYRAKGYDDEWIEARIRNKASRELLTSEWNTVGMTRFIGILTDSISIETFGLSTGEHKRIKGLSKSHNLRDNMTPIELTLTTLGEQATTEIIKTTKPTTLTDNKIAAARGGRIAGTARQDLELATGQKIVSPTNYLTPKQRKNNMKLQNPDISQLLQKLLGKSSN